ncbi:MAG: dimethyladenosine transferase [Acidimicrobiaceae bacterium]|jgi:uncharacterized protein YndB with AHSA1/START domain|nr:dimethyladenosine transferase [Acidimicrobiaceae bacterium]
MDEREVSVSKTIAVPPRTIFAILTNPSKHPLIDGSGSVGRERSGIPTRLGPGSRFSMDMKGVVPYRMTNTVVEFEEDRLIAWRHFGGHRWRWRLEPAGDGATTVTETFDWSTAISPRLIERVGYPERNRVGIVATLDRLDALVAPSAG